MDQRAAPPPPPPAPPMDAEAARLIDALGGTVAAAHLFQVTPQAVTQWRRNGIPKPRLMFLQVAKPALFDEAARAA